MVTPRPSDYILRKAWKLGQKMARTERRIVADVRGAHQYPTFVLFTQTHRYRLEQYDAMIPWDERIQRLIEREANAHGVPLDNPRVWDAFFNHIEAPIRAAFWYGWEQAKDLHRLYEEEVEARRRPAVAPVLHVCPQPAVVAQEGADRPDDAERELWDQVAHKLFDEMHADDEEKMWSLPSPDDVLSSRPSTAA